MRNYKTSLLLLFFSIGFSQNPKIEKTKYIEGVKTLIEKQYVYEEKFGEFIDRLSGKFIYEFNTDGNILKKSTFNSDGSLDSKVLYTYNSSKKLVAEDHYIKSNLNSEYIYEYDRYGYNFKKSYYNKDGLQSVTKNEFDFKGNKIKETVYNADGSLYSVRKLKFDSQGNYLTADDYKFDGTLKWRFIAERDSVGNLIKEKKYFGDGKIVWTKQYSYNEMGDQTYSSFLMDGFLVDGFSRNKYDKNNKLIEMFWFKYESKFNEMVKIPHSKYTFDYIYH